MDVQKEENIHDEGNNKNKDGKTTGTGTYDMLEGQAMH